MGLINLLKMIEKLFPPIPKIGPGRNKKDMERKIVSRYAEGNVYLLLGKYVTTDEVDRRRSDLASYDFSGK